VGDLDGAGEDILLDEPSIPGMWRVVTTGAGGVSVGGVELFEITPGGGTMTDGVVDP
jgi:hypothetical protein